MQHDRYDNELTTNSREAADAYRRGMDLFLAAHSGVDEAFQQAIDADTQFILPRVALARNLQINARAKEARQVLADARALDGPLSDWEQGNIHALGLLIDGKVPAGYVACREQLANHPRDVLVAGACLGVFGLIGFSGQPGREAETLALAESLAPHYGDDWWFLSALSFSQIEVGQVGPAEKTIERALELNPRNANAAHHRAHLYYEVGETDQGLSYLKDWLPTYDRAALMHCHLSWHVGLWELGRGNVDAMWQVIDADVNPETSLSPSLNILTDHAAILYRAELAGVEVPESRWQQVSRYASENFPKPGLAFADVHAALAHAMAGNGEALQKVITDARGPAGDMVKLLSEAFGSIASGAWEMAADQLSAVMTDHARLGGSRAQRDMIDHALCSVLLRLGKGDEAARLLLMRRPLTATKGVVAGLEV